MMHDENHKLAALFAYALDASASEAEAANAAARAIAFARRRGMKAAELACALGSTSPGGLFGGSNEPPDIEPGELVMPFGVNKGKTLGELLRENPGFLRWVVRERVGDPLLQRAARSLLESATIRTAKARGGRK